MQIVDLMGNQPKTETEIWRTTEDMVASVVPPDRERVLSRLWLAVQVTPVLAEMGYLTTEQVRKFGATDAPEFLQLLGAAYAAEMAATQARANNALLIAVLAYEAALGVLAQPVPEFEATVKVFDTSGASTDAPNPAIAQDAAERADAQAVIDAATPEVLTLYDLRHPVELLPEAAQNAVGEA